MSKRRPYIGPSDAQANAEALRYRDSPYTAASDVSFRVAWDWHRREPSDLREAVRMVRRAYADEVPAKLHDGRELADDGTPRMTAKAEGYIFGNAQGSDAVKVKCVCATTDEGPPWHSETCPRNPKNAPLVSYYHAPFRAKLDEWQHGDEGSRKRAAIVSHVTIGQQGPQQAAIAEGVPSWAAKCVAEDALRAFLRAMTDLKLHLNNRPDTDGSTVAA